MLRALVLLVTLAMPAPASTLVLEAESLGHLADLLARGGHGRMPLERGAFLVREADGSASCVLWPVTGEFRASHWTGSVPPGTFAVAHTHPLDQPNPSPGDFATAETLGIPVVVVTPRRIVAAIPGSRDAEVLAGGFWSRGAARLACRDQPGD